MRRSLLTIVLGVLVQSCLHVANPPALKSIRIEDLKTDLHEMAGPHFNGRSAGTLDELKASAWYARKLNEAGIEPAGDDSTYFQYFSVRRSQINQYSKVTIGDASLRLWKDVLVASTTPSSISAPVLYLGPVNKVDLHAVDVKGKAVALISSPVGIEWRSLPEWRYPDEQMARYGDALLARGAAAIIFIADEYGEHSWDYMKQDFVQGSYELDESKRHYVFPGPPVLWLHANALKFISSPGLVLTADLQLNTYTYPSMNVVGKVTGTDPKLSNEFVLLSGHPDAHGVRNVIGGDSICYGADDNGSVAVAMLAVMRAFKKSPGRRSALIVMHGAEERGLFGSRWYSTHPTVPFSSIVAVLNGDMIGRNHPDSAAVMGIQLPHRNSKELAKMVLDANAEGPQFKLDTLWDNPTHPEVWYFRSDHLPYAWNGIPAVEYSTLLHPDYHTPKDNPQNIDYTKLTKMTEWIYRTAWKVANADERPGLDPNFNLER